ncbi:hypothetical protein BDR05DRAFT_997714 [Suillus weaverae]|nr:hypothetical protein BDR05DRAFT_997714 [Suillus weaverae]
MTEFNSSACHADGSLKDASKITFYYDADDDVPLPPSVDPDDDRDSSPPAVAEPDGSLSDGYDILLDPLSDGSNLLSDSDGYVPGSAVPSEQAFSSGGITSTIHCNSLAPSTFSALQLLKAAYKYGYISAVSEASRESAALAKLSELLPDV